MPEILIPLKTISIKVPTVKPPSITTILLTTWLSVLTWQHGILPAKKADATHDPILVLKPIGERSASWVAAKNFMESQSKACREVAALVRSGSVTVDKLPEAVKSARMPASKGLADAIMAAPDKAVALEDAASAMEVK